MQKPRILALLPFLVKEALSLSLLRAMRARGFDIHIVFCEDVSHIYSPDDLPEFAAEDRLADLSSKSQPARLAFLTELIAQRGIDLVLQIGAADLYHHLPYLKERKSGLRIVDILYNEFGHTVSHFLYEECIDGVIVESEKMRRFVEGASSKPEPNVRVLQNGIDLGVFVPAPERQRRAGLAVGYVGRMSDEKNPLGFVELAERLFETLPEVTFHMFGGGNQADIVRRRVEGSPARARLRYHGHAADPKAALHQLDVLVLPSKFDGRPNIVMEANACAIPVIAAPVGGVPELIEEGRNGYLAAPGEAGRIAELLSGWIAQPETLDRLKDSSRAVALARFDRSRTHDDFEAALCAFASG